MFMRLLQITFLRKILRASGLEPDWNIGIRKLHMKLRIKQHHTTTQFLLWAEDMCGSFIKTSI